MATSSSILAWRIPWTEEPGGLQSMGLQRIGIDLVTKQHPIHFALCRYQLGLTGPLYHLKLFCPC